MTLAQLRLRKFRRSTIAEVFGTSRTSLWRRARKPDSGFRTLEDWTGSDVVKFLQKHRADAGLPPHDEADILNALADTEDAFDRAKAEAAPQVGRRLNETGRSHQGRRPEVRRSSHMGRTLSSSVHVRSAEPSVK